MDVNVDMAFPGSRDTGFERVTLVWHGEIDGSSCVDDAYDQSGVGQGLSQRRQRRRRSSDPVLVAMSHPTNGTASNFRVAKFRDSSGLVAPRRISERGSPALPPISAAIFELQICKYLLFS